VGCSGHFHLLIITGADADFKAAAIGIFTSGIIGGLLAAAATAMAAGMAAAGPALTAAAATAAYRGPAEIRIKVVGIVAVTAAVAAVIRDLRRLIFNQADENAVEITAGRAAGTKNRRGLHRVFLPFRGSKGSIASDRHCRSFIVYAKPRKEVRL